MTFDVDANGILNVSAVEKSTHKENKITITNDKGRLTKEDIERMVNEAERYHAEDESQKERIIAKNNLESYCFNMKNTIEDGKVKEKIAEGDRKRIADKCNEIIKWLDTSNSATKEQFEHKLKDAEKVWFFKNHFFFLRIIYYTCVNEKASLSSFWIMLSFKTLSYLNCELQEIDELVGVLSSAGS